MLDEAALTERVEHNRVIVICFWIEIRR